MGYNQCKFTALLFTALLSCSCPMHKAYTYNVCIKQTNADNDVLKVGTELLQVTDN
jgi:hypothetical protein